MDPFNNDFYSTENQQFYCKILAEYTPPLDKPIVFVPCANANKTRKKYGKKKISESTSHQYLSAITKDSKFEKIIISEPLTVIPYSYEHLMPDYNYPPKMLFTSPPELIWKDDWQLARRLGIFLYVLKQKQPTRTTIYYIGGKHHARLLEKANDNLFILSQKLPGKEGIRGYARLAKELVEEIFPSQEVLQHSLEEYLIT